ncbi:MAG: PAS domain-containing sensor histidine kinase [Planctomycetes bacterium]|nr:PAS domain-containing sensor histidine kinase [Planctomycetota bacterium]
MARPDLADDLGVKLPTENDNPAGSDYRTGGDSSLRPLRALARISQCILEHRNRDYLFRDVVGMLPFAMTHPGMTNAKIEFEGQSFYSDAFCDSPWQIRASLVVGGQKLGSVVIGYSEESPEQHEGPFSKGERFFIDTVARMLSLGIEQRRAKDSLCDAEQKFLAMFNNALNGVLLVERFTKRCCLANDKLCEMLGYGLDEIVDLTVADIQPSLASEDVVEQLCDPLLGRHSLTENVPLKRKNGSTMYVDMSSFPIVVGNRRYLLDIFKEVTERRWAQQQQLQVLDQLRGANRELSEFVRVLQVDVKALLGRVNLWRDTVSQAEDPVQLDALVGRAERLGALISTVSQYSAIGTRSETTLVDLNDLVQETVSRLALPEGVEILREGTWPVARFDRAKMTDVLYHLLANGVQSLSAGAGSIRLRCVEEASRYTLSVSDTGRGIDEQEHDRIFQMFYRILDDTEAEDRLGMGLTVVRKSVEAWGGRIWVESEVGTGSTFYFTVPKGPARNLLQ